MAKAAQAEARRHAAGHYAVAHNDKDTSVGVPAKSRFGRGALAGSYLAGQLLASLRGASECRHLGEEHEALSNPYERTACLAYLGAVEGGSFVFVMSIDGIPLLEECGSAANVRKAIEVAREQLSRDAVFLVQAAEPVANEFRDLLTEFRGIATPVAGLPYGVQLQRDHVGLKAVGLHPLVRGGVIAAGVVSVCSLSYWGLTTYQGYSLSAEQLTRKQQMARSGRQQYLSAQQEVLAKEGVVVAAAAAEPIWHFVSRIATDRAGFTLAKVSCKGGTCSLAYRREARQRTFTDFVNAHTKNEAPRFDISQLDDATTGVQIPGYEKVPVVDLSTVKYDPSLLLRLGTTAQQVLLGGVKLTFTAPGDMVTNANQIPGLRSADLQALRRIEGKWTLEGPTDTFTAALKRLPPIATLSEVEFRLAADPSKGPDTVVARGRYFVVPDPTVGVLQ